MVLERFIPEKVVINPRSLDYETGRKAKAYFESLDIPVVIARSIKIEGELPQEIYSHSKRTVYITLNNEKKLRTCSPSADYQFALTSSCPGHCEYCYLQTTQGEKPFIKIFANVEEILKTIQRHIDENESKITTFECSSITDPIPFEPITGSLEKTINYFGKSEKGRLRFVTKYHMVDSLLDAHHNGHTTFRFSINTKTVIHNYEHNTSTLDERISAIKKVSEAGYPIGFIIAPIMIYPNWKEEYESLLFQVSRSLSKNTDLITFELIQHRYTETAKALIYKRFPKTKLDMNDENRQLKWGPYGKFKYVYKKEDSKEIKEHLSFLINKYFENKEIEYFT